MNAHETQALAILVAQPVLPARMRGLAEELAFAVKQADSSLLRAWGLDAARTFATSFTRRVTNVWRLVDGIVRGTWQEGRGAAEAYKNDALASYLKLRAQAGYQATSDGVSGLANFLRELVAGLRSNPKEVAPQLLVLVVSSLLVSGGPDGDGGAPDLDLMFGIDAHRSILSHSIFMGATLEAGILSLLNLVTLVHAKLPPKHDPLWDSMRQQASAIAHAANQGASIGMAYHLFVDGLAQPHPYTDIPGSMPIEAHQAVFVANASAEVVDAGKKPGDSALAMDALQRKNLEDKQKTYLRIPFEVHPRISKFFDSDELSILHKKGNWMQALASGELETMSLEQEHFVMVARGQLQPESRYERVWARYRKAARKIDE